jgi:cobalt-zinc-cadmium resistance protein CzcA
LAEEKLRLTRLEVRYNTSLAWYRAIMAKEKLQLYRQLDSIRINFMKAAELRLKTQQISRIEYLSVSAKYTELDIRIREAAGDYMASLLVLNQYMMFPPGTTFEVIWDLSEPFELVSSLYEQDSSVSYPRLDLYNAQSDLARAEWGVERTRFLPKIDLGYTRQSIEGNSGYYGWEAGISMPLVFYAQSARTRAAKIAFDMNEQEYQKKEQEINAVYHELRIRLQSMREVLNYYEKDALPLADEQIRAAYLGYRVGELDYNRFIRNFEDAIDTRLDYFDRKTAYFEMEQKIYYLTGK